MQKFTLSLLLLTLFSMGCGGPRYVDYFPYDDEGIAKPRVILVPVFNSTNCDLPWDLSDEFTQRINYEMMDHGKLYVMPCQFNSLQKKDFFNQNLSAVAPLSGEADFILVAELFEHKVTPYVRGQTKPIYPAQYNSCNQVLAMKLRVRIIDLRGGTTKILHQEVIESNHMVSKDKERSYALAHERLIAEFVNRIENITWNAI